MKGPLHIARLVFLVTLLGAGCTKSDNPIRKSCYPATISTTSSGYTTGVAYTYDGNFQVISTVSTSTSGSSSEVVTTTYTYNGNGDIISAATNSNLSGSSTSTYAYDISHNLIQVDHYKDVIHLDKYIYAYNTTLQLTGVEYTIYIGSGTSVSTIQYEYATPVARNPTKATSSSGTVWQYEYDTRPNPLKVLFVSLQPDNNVTKMTFQNPGGPVTQTTYTYQYDANGYPAARTGTDGEVKGYTYNCK